MSTCYFPQNTPKLIEITKPIQARIAALKFDAMFYKAEALYTLFRFEEAMIQYHR